MNATIAVTIFALFVFGGLFTYTVYERRHRFRWARTEARPLPATGGPFRRDAEDSPTHLVRVPQRAPKTIRRAALWSIYMGQMALPGGLLGLFGTLFAGIGLVSIPGMILAVRIWRLSYAMLRRDPKAEDEARRLVRFAVRLNLVGLAVAVALVALGGLELAGISLVLWVYGAVSFAHAAAMRRCADILAEDRRARAASTAAWSTEAARGSAPAPA